MIAILVALAFVAYFAVLWLWGTIFAAIDALPLAVLAAIGIFHLGYRHGQKGTR